MYVMSNWHQTFFKDFYSGWIFTYGCVLPERLIGAMSKNIGALKIFIQRYGTQIQTVKFPTPAPVPSDSQFLIAKGSDL